MEGLLKTYATRLARKHLLQKIGPQAQATLEVEEQLCEMAQSRLREELLGMEECPEESVIAALVRREAAMVVLRYAEDEDVRSEVRAAIAALPDSDILPKVH